MQVPPSLVPMSSTTFGGDVILTLIQEEQVSFTENVSLEPVNEIREACTRTVWLG